MKSPRWTLTLRWAVGLVWLPWLVSRVIVLAALGVARELVTTIHPDASASARVHQGLLGWDAGWYQSISLHGYGGVGHSALRFFPMLPLLAHAVTWLPGIDTGAALLLITNVSAFVAAILLVVLCRREMGDVSLGRRAVWLLCLAPPAFTLVMGYATATLLALSIGAFLALRRRNWLWAALCGFLAGATQPLGVLLAFPALVEISRGWRTVRLPERGNRLLAMIAPAAGCGAFLAWVGWRYGNAFAPLNIQQQVGHRGPFLNPLVAASRQAGDLLHGRHLDTALHLPWEMLVAVLVIVSLRRLPISYGIFAGAVLLVAISTSNPDSFERYALCAFPIVVAGAMLTAGESVQRAVMVLMGSGLLMYGLLAFLNVYVP